MIRIYSLLKIYILLFMMLLASIIATAQETRQLAVDKPQAIADLKTNEGAALLQAKWYVQPAHVHNKDFHLPGQQTGGGDALPLYPTGGKIKTHTLRIFRS